MSRWLAVWGTPVAIGIVVVLGLANYRATERSAVDSFTRRQLAWTRTVSVGVDGNIARHQASLAHLAALPSVQYLTVDFLGPRLAQFFGRPQRPGVLEILRVDAQRNARSWYPDGRMVRADAEPWRDEAVWAWNADAAHREHLHGWVRMEHGQRRLLITRPIVQTAASDVYPRPTGRQDGFVGLLIDPATVVGTFAQSVFETFPGSSLIVLDDAGQMMWAGGPRVDPLVAPQATTMAFDAQAAQGEVETPAGTMLVTTVPLVVADQTWTIWAAVPRRLATADVQRSFLRQMVPFLLLIATTAGLGWAMRRVAASESRYRALFEQAADGIFVVGSDGRIADVNAAGAALAGRPAAGLAGMPLTDVITPADLPPWQQAIERLGPAQRASLPLTIVTPGGAAVTTDASLSRGAAGRTLLLVRDVREQRQLEAQLQQAQKMEAVGRLAGGVAHDFNNLLTAISGCNELLLASLDASDGRRADALQIRHATERAASLTRQLLAFGRKQVLQPRVIVLNELVDNVERLLRRLVGEHITIRTALAPHLWAVEADPGQIEQVLVNLIVNARDAMASGGHITLETANVEVALDAGTLSTGVMPVPGVRLSVVDDGHGMDADTAAKIFEPFFTTKPLGTGTGLGLPTAYGIVRQSRGEIRVVTTPGAGTRFDIVLPRSYRPTAAAPQVRPATPHLQAAAGAGSVLLVEDDPDVRRFAARTLERLGYTVHAAENGLIALSLLDAVSATLDVVVTDLVMPEMNGVALAAAIHEHFPHLPVLLMSGHSMDLLEAQGVSHVPGALLAKPFTASQLAEAIRAVRASAEARSTGGAS